LFIAWVVFHVMVCFALILVVLMQSAKGEGLAGGTAFGGGVGTAVFGGRGAASFLSKSTTVLAIVFFINCGALALMSSSERVTTSADNTTTTAAPESAVTRRAQRERDEQMQRTQGEQDAAMQDSLARQAGETPALNLDSLGLGDTTAPSGN
jgi:preprotein translocase subunit SecG